jgi:hypothetical protein
MPDERLAASSLILADKVEPLPPRQIGSNMYTLGSEKVIPNVRQEFRRDQDLNLWLQVYGLKVDEATHKPSATVETLITRDGKEVKKLTETATDLSGAAQQMTLMKDLSLADFDPGDYAIQVKITDNLTKELIAQTGKFKVR